MNCCDIFPPALSFPKETGKDQHFGANSLLSGDITCALKSMLKPNKHFNECQSPVAKRVCKYWTEIELVEGSAFRIPRQIFVTSSH